MQHLIKYCKNVVCWKQMTQRLHFLNITKKKIKLFASIEKMAVQKLFFDVMSREFCILKMYERRYNISCIQIFHLNSIFDKNRTG